jgi:hypothetical protein
MNFKQFVTEADSSWVPINYNDIMFKLKHIAWMNDLTGVVTPEKERTESTLVYCFLDSKNGTWWLKNRQLQGTTFLYQVIQKPTWYKREKQAYKRSYERALFEKKFVNETAPKLIKDYEFKQSLNKNTADTFGDIISEL